MRTSRGLRGGRGTRSAVLDFLERENFSRLRPAQQRELLESVINLAIGGGPAADDSLGLYGSMAREIGEFPAQDFKAVVFGGGTGLSTIIGGDPSHPAWPAAPFAGLKMLFRDLTVVVCVTDDGGSSGELVRRLPIIALGDIRRAVVAGITPRHLRIVFRGITEEQIAGLPAALQRIMNLRIAGRGPKSVLSLLSAKQKAVVPEPLAAYLEGLWNRFRKHPALAGLPLADHCLGNLLLVAEIYRDAGRGRGGRFVPGHRDIVDGIHRFGRRLGCGWKTVYPVSSGQGVLKFLYTNGVVATGEHKSSVSRRGFAVDRVWAEYPGGARVDPRLIAAIDEAEIIITAPGSVYSSLVPILQVEEVAAAVRRNRRAVKILGANFWVQKGETDITIRDLGKEFFVSDLIEAYNKNVPGGTAGLFKQVVYTNLRNIPADVIQNYALEGKVPIYLDKGSVERLGFEPLAVEVHSLERLEKGKVFQHDPAKFAQTVRTLLFLRGFLGRSWVGAARAGRRPPRASPAAQADGAVAPGPTLASDHMRDVELILARLDIASLRVRKLLPDLLWENRDIRSDHLRFLRGIRVVPRERWERATVWDRILAYFDPSDSFLNLRSDLLEGDERRLKEDLLIGLGESLLGNYAGQKSVRLLREGSLVLGKVFEIKLRDEGALEAFLSLDQIRAFLELAHLRASPREPNVYRLVINHNDAFTPPGLLFGLLYSWYLDNSFGCVIEYEMSLLKIATSDLLPKLTMDKERRKKLIEFFRTNVFRH